MKIKSSISKDHPSEHGTVAVAQYILKHGPLLPTSELCNVYKMAEGSSRKCKIMSAELFDILSKHLNIIQVYIKGQAFICENTSSDFQAMISFLNKQARDRKELNNKVEDAIGGCFAEALNFMDSKRDRDTVTALMERLTSVNFFAEKLLRVQNKRAVQGCRDSLMANLHRFREVKLTSQVVRNDMTNQQRRLALKNC